MFILISIVPLSGGTIGFALVFGSVFGRCYGEIIKYYFGV
jgi:hypothetical protein